MRLPPARSAPDWIEVTNFGDMSGDTGVLYYDDESPSVGSGVPLPSFNLSTGESAVFIVTNDAESGSITEFTNIWGTIPNLGFAPGGGGLSQNGDEANILLVDGTVVDSLTFNRFSGTSTLEDPTGMGPNSISMIGVNGAYESNPFFNDSIGGDDDSITLVGSPGAIANAIPEPAAGLMLVLGGVLAVARRR